MQQVLKKVWEVLRPCSVSQLLQWMRQLQAVDNLPPWFKTLCQCVFLIMDSDQVDGLGAPSIEYLLQACEAESYTTLLPSATEIQELFAECVVPSVKQEQDQLESSALYSTQNLNSNISMSSTTARGIHQHAGANGWKKSETSSSLEILDDAFDRRIFSTKKLKLETLAETTLRTYSSIFLKKGDQRLSLKLEDECSGQYLLDLRVHPGLLYHNRPAQERWKDQIVTVKQWISPLMTPKIEKLYKNLLAAIIEHQEGKGKKLIWTSGIGAG